jgi:hypothetical protein
LIFDTEPRRARPVRADALAQMAARPPVSFCDVGARRDVSWGTRPTVGRPAQGAVAPLDGVTGDRKRKGFAVGVVIPQNEGVRRSLAFASS